MNLPADFTREDVYALRMRQLQKAEGRKGKVPPSKTKGGVSTCPERQKLNQIVIQGFADGHSCQQTADLVGVTPARIAQLRQDLRRVGAIPARGRST